MGTTYYQILKTETGDWEFGDIITHNGEPVYFYEDLLEIAETWETLHPGRSSNEDFVQHVHDDLVGEGNLMLPDDWILNEEDLNEFCNRYVEMFPDRVGRYVCLGKYPSNPLK